MERDKAYDLLLQGSVSDVDENLDPTLQIRSPSGVSRWIWRSYVLGLLLTGNLLAYLSLVKERHPISIPTDDIPTHYARIEPLPIIYKQLDWWTEYSDKNSTRVDALWDDINPAHGFIAMDRTWAKENYWPDAMHLPSDDSKNVYLLESYHLLHCLTVLRTMFWEAVRGEEKLSWKPPHAGHCFDMMRQYIVCHADNTPLYAFGDNTAGDRQYRQCRDWNVLRDFATNHTACYRDYPKAIDHDAFSLGEHFGYCDGGHDGMIVAAERRGNW